MGILHRESHTGLSWRLLSPRWFGGISGEVRGEDLNKLFVNFPGVSFQGFSLWWLVGARAGGHWSMQLVLQLVMVSLVWFYCFSGPETETTEAQMWCLRNGHARAYMGGTWSHSLVPCCSSKRVYHMTSDARGGKVRGGSKPHDPWYEGSEGLNPVTSDILGEERLPWGMRSLFS